MHEHHLQYILVTAVVISMTGVMYQLLRYLSNRLSMKKPSRRRTETSYPADVLSWRKAFWLVNVNSYLRYWWKANPLMFLGHVFYHGGLFAALGIYGLLFLGTFQISHLSVGQRIFMVCNWFEAKQVSELLGSAELLFRGTFLAAAALACLGITIPFAASAFKRRGMVRPIDHVLAGAAVTRLSGLKTQGSTQYSRKFVGLIVLIMDWMLLMTVAGVLPAAWTCTVHISFFSLVLALLPFNFLFHEVYRVRMLEAVRAVRTSTLS